MAVRFHLDAYDPATVFSSIDQNGRYAYGNQPHIGLWNLMRLAEALLRSCPVMRRRPSPRRIEALSAYSGKFEATFMQGLGASSAAD